VRVYLCYPFLNIAPPVRSPKPIYFSHSPPPQFRANCGYVAAALQCKVPVRAAAVKRWSLVVACCTGGFGSRSDEPAALSTRRQVPEQHALPCRQFDGEFTAGAVSAGGVRAAPDDFRGQVEAMALAVADLDEQLLGRGGRGVQQDAHSRRRHVEQFTVQNFVRRCSRPQEPHAGVGFDPQNIDRTDGSGLGLFGMQERTALFSGKLKIDSAPNRGTTVSVRIPLPDGAPIESEMTTAEVTT
jgi:hypothetical protein